MDRGRITRGWGPCAALLGAAWLLAGRPIGGGAGDASAQAQKAAKGPKKGAKPAPSATSGKVLVWLRVGKEVEGGVQVTVQPGQRLQDIAEAYGLGVPALVAANTGLDPASIVAGQKIFVPGAAKVLAIKTWVPEDKLDEIPGMSAPDEPHDKKKEKKPKDSGSVMVKSGVKVNGGVKHTIQPGQTIGMIAQAYGVSAASIVKASGLKNADSVKPGQKVLVPGVEAVVAVEAKPTAEQDLALEHKVKSGKVVKAGVLHVVQPGQTLGIIASAYSVSVDAILDANSLADAHSIKQGQKILVPGAKAVVAVKADPKKALAMPTVATFQNLHTGETKKLTLASASGKLVPGECAKLEKLMADPKKGKTHKIHPRLVYLLKTVAANWPGQVITIYSGYRVYTPGQYTKKSKHNLGRAIDFSVEGVSNLKLMKFLRTFENAGVGYYPNSYFIHLDVRETPAFWVDYAGPGEAPKYKKWKEGAKGKAEGEDVNVEADSDASDVDVKKK